MLFRSYSLTPIPEAKGKTAESTVQLLEALEKSAGEMSNESMWDRPVDSKLKGLLKPGPKSGRHSCENSAGLTNLTSKKWGPELTRKDL